MQMNYPSLEHSSQSSSTKNKEMKLNEVNGVTIPTGVQEMFRHCTEGRGLLGNIIDRWTDGLVDLGYLFQPW